MTRMLDLLESYLQQCGHNPARLDGSMSYEVCTRGLLGCQSYGDESRTLKRAQLTIQCSAGLLFLEGICVQTLPNPYEQDLDKKTYMKSYDLHVNNCPFVPCRHVRHPSMLSTTTPIHGCSCCQRVLGAWAST